MRRALPIVLLATTLAACAALPEIRPLPANQGVGSMAGITANQQLVRIRTKSAAQRIELLSDGFDLFAIQGNDADAVITPKQAEALKGKGISFKALGKSGRFGGPDKMPAGYKTVDQVHAQLRAWQTQNPQIVSLEDVGDSWEKTQGQSPTHDILALTLGTKGTGKPALLITAGVHARELAPVELAMTLAQELIDGYGANPEITNWLNTRQVVIVPVANPDGRKMVERGASMWRKTTHTFPGGRGVDLNRNFDAHWNYAGVSAPPGWSNSRWESFKAQCQDPQADIYSGPAAGSEPETQAIGNIYKTKRITVAVDLHAYGEMMIWPLGYTTAPTPHDALFRRLHQRVAPRYRGGTSMQLLYPTSGTTKDFAYEKFQTPGFTIEVGNQMDGFSPAYSRVAGIYAELGPGLKYLVSVADNPAAAR